MFAKKLNKVSFAFNGLIAALGLLASVSTQAAIYGGVDFPGGASSFADAVVSYDPTLGGRLALRRVPETPCNRWAYPPAALTTVS
jgi:hypothetical protein